MSRAMGESVTFTADDAVRWLKQKATRATREGMARYALPTDHALGVTMRDVQALAKLLGKNHRLALALWDTRWYEARVLAAYVDDPAQVTAAQMDRWCRDFDNWGTCDTLCFVLFDKTKHAWTKVTAWSRLKGEYQKRAAFALIWSLSVHDKQAPDASFLRALTLIERAATDERHFVKKAVNMAIRATGKRNAALHAAAVATARRLAESADATARWVGKDALRELTGPGVARRLSRQKQRRRSA